MPEGGADMGGRGGSSHRQTAGGIANIRTFLQISLLAHSMYFSIIPCRCIPNEQRFFTNDATDVDAKLREDKERLDRWWRDKQFREEMEAFA